MKKYYGQLDALAAIRYVSPLHETGDTHIAAYDFANQYIYVSNASPYDPNANPPYIPAYDRPFTRFDMKELFAVQL
jgi:hypothetical protein